MDKTASSNPADMLSVNVPPPGGDGPVRSYSPQAPMGTLCRASGRFTPPVQGLPGMARLIIKKPGDPAPTSADWGSAQMVGMAPDGSWPYGSMPSLGAWIAPAGSTALNNTLYAKAFWYDYSTYPPTTYQSDTASSSFRGVYVQQCPAAALAAEPSAAQLEPLGRSPASLEFLAVESPPAGGEDGWLEYRNLSVDNLAFGNRLMLGDRPLRASLLAVSAVDVGWWHGMDPPRLVRRAQGHLTAAQDGWLFRNSPEASLIVWQGDMARRTVLAAEDRTRPDVVDLDPCRDIYVQVNYDMLDAFARRGGFSLWVKVLA